MCVRARYKWTTSEEMSYVPPFVLADDQLANISVRIYLPLLLPTFMYVDFNYLVHIAIM